MLAPAAARATAIPWPMPLLAPVTSAFLPSSVISTVARPPRRGRRSVGGRGMRGGFPHAVRGMYGAPGGIPHQEGESEGDEADRSADVERLVHAEDKHLSHRVEYDGKLIAHPGRDDRRDHLHASIAHKLDELIADGVISNRQRAKLWAGVNP